MVKDHGCFHNALHRFAEPPWDVDSSRWIEIDDDLPADHLARQIKGIVEDLDLAPLLDSYSGRGLKPHRPDLMLGIVLFEIRRGRHHPSNWFVDVQENQALGWLGMGIRPARSCWYDFRDRLGPFLDGFNAQVLQHAVEEGMTTGEQAALDGSALAANASRRRLINQPRLDRRLEELRVALVADEQGQTPEKVPAWMARLPATRLEQYDRFQHARRRLETLLAANERRIPSARRPIEKIVVSTSDPEAAVGLDKEHVFRPLYNTQTVRDVDSQFILGYDVFAQPTDAGTLKPMLERVAYLSGRWIKDLLVDSGYVTAGDLVVAAAEGVTLYGPWKENDYSESKKKPSNQLFSKDDFQWLDESNCYECPAGELLSLVGRETRTRSGEREEILLRYACPAETCRACTQRERCTASKQGGRSVRRSEHEHLITAHRRRMDTPEAKARYKVRGQTIEIVYADMKEHRRLRRHSGRGLKRVRIELALEVLTHNSMILYRSRAAPPKNTPAVPCQPEKQAA